MQWHPVQGAVGRTAYFKPLERGAGQEAVASEAEAEQEQQQKQAQDRRVSAQQTSKRWAFVTHGFILLSLIRDNRTQG
jgi:hypothetical protein